MIGLPRLIFIVALRTPRRIIPSFIHGLMSTEGYDPFHSVWYSDGRERNNVIKTIFGTHEISARNGAFSAGLPKFARA